MFNVTSKGNFRCNGLVNTVAGGMVKRAPAPPASAKLPPALQPSQMGLNTMEGCRAQAAFPADKPCPEALPEDPYRFSDGPEPQVAVKAPRPQPHQDSDRAQTAQIKKKVIVRRTRDSTDARNERSPDNKFANNSIIGLGNKLETNKAQFPLQKVMTTGKPLPEHLKARRANIKATHHEALQRIRKKASFTDDLLSDSTKNDNDNDSEDDSRSLFQQHWFCGALELLLAKNSNRESRIELMKSELQKQLMQMIRSKAGQPRSNEAARTVVCAARNNFDDVASSLLKKRFIHLPSRISSKSSKLLATKTCDVENCSRGALPCTRYCSLHIMNNTDQVLFDFCTAKFADNTQCSVPVFDIAHELPLCTEHARKRDNYNRMCQETKPKKPRKKVKPSAMIRPQKRSKKRKRPPKTLEVSQAPLSVNRSNSFTESAGELNVCENSSAYESSEDMGLGGLSESEFVTIKEEQIGEQDVVDQVLAMQEEVGGEELELVSVEQALVNQASRLLEETDFTTVLNQIPADAFNDLFADRNGEYEPTREETEELERALEAVDEDVKSLEKLSQSQGILDSLLDEHALVESLVHMPDVFHNGFASSVNVVGPAGHSGARPMSALHQVDGMIPVQTQANAPT